MSRFTLKQFEDFLKKVDLDSYREKYSKIKIVEMDLPRNIQALQTIYEQYWDNIDNRKKLPSFDEYYDIYWKRHKKEIKEFQKKSGFGSDCDCFERGLKARIYRTWASLVTQIQGGYVAETIFGKGNIKMSAELDHQGADILVTNNDGSDRLKIQVKKETHRREIARMHSNNIKKEKDVFYLYYVVPNDYDDPYYKRNGKGYKKGDEKPFVKLFKKWYPKTAVLDRLGNGFIIFTKNAFTDFK